MVVFVRKHKGKVKTCTYSMMHMSVAITVAFILSGSWTVALSIGFIEPVVQTFAYVFHERIWTRLLHI